MADGKPKEPKEPKRPREKAPPPDPLADTWENRITELAPESEVIAGIQSGGMTLTERRVELIRDMMVAGLWLARWSDRRLAQAWGCSRSRVEALATEASRLIRHDLRQDPEALDELRAEVIQTFARLAFRAEQMATATGDTRGYRYAAEIVHKRAQYLGIAPAEKLELTGDKDEFEGWSLEEKQRYAETGEMPSRKAVGRALVAAAKVPGADG